VRPLHERKRVRRRRRRRRRRRKGRESYMFCSGLMIE
jgi:hypothetical protein